MMLGQVVKVQKERVAACMTCPLCDKLFRDATTISECLHTFCRKCIYMKITDEELDNCPVCDIELGCSPLEKLRADHSLQDLRAKIFPSKRKKVREPATVSSVTEAVPSVSEAVLAVPEAVPVQESEHSVPLIGRRKERSLSSLVVSTPKISVKSVLTGKRSKSVARKRESPIPVGKQVKKVDDYYESLSSPETLSKIAQTKRQKLDTQEEEAQALKTSIKDHGDKSKVIGEESNSTSSPSGLVKPRRLQAMRQKRAAPAPFEGFNIPAQAAVDANSKCDRIFSQIWFSLVASDEQEGVAPLPQISSCYLRVKDGSLPVSHIKKYLVQKLGHVSEAEVEILLLGQPVDSTLKLHNLVDWWLTDSFSI
ncbi:hypothetical protein OIU77_011682 [Salix suchowensis]|uniref:RING-type domain-containing protein n=1 Tax=Salix suchowensis TaxID=1278906 RepID=A0ABQ9A2U8_9ROSI|nr:hypothetical protein OIU77_011682 [Salix suchowensis]